MPINVEKKVEDLRDQLRYHSHRYYVLDDPDIPDAEYRRTKEQTTYDAFVNQVDAEEKEDLKAAEDDKIEASTQEEVNDDKTDSVEKDDVKLEEAQPESEKPIDPEIETKESV